MQSPATPRQSSQCWALPKGSAQSFSAHREGVLKVTAGRAWVTFGPGSDPATGHAPQSPTHEDLFLVAGARLPLVPGQTVVLEAWPAGSAAGTGLVWEPSCAARSGAGVGRLLQALARAGHALVERLQARYGFAAALRLTRPWYTGEVPAGRPYTMVPPACSRLQPPMRHWPPFWRCST